jgi:hypothetical protein
MWRVLCWNVAQNQPRPSQSRGIGHPLILNIDKFVFRTRPLWSRISRGAQESSVPSLRVLMGGRTLEFEGFADGTQYGISPEPLGLEILATPSSKYPELCISASFVMVSYLWGSRELAGVLPKSSQGVSSLRT